MGKPVGRTAALGGITLDLNVRNADVLVWIPKDPCVSIQSGMFSRDRGLECAACSAWVKVGQARQTHCGLRQYVVSFSVSSPS